MRKKGLLTSFCLSALALVAAYRVGAAEPRPDQQRTALAVEALKKLEGADLEQNAALKAAVSRVIKAIHGTPDFVELIEKFNVRGHEAALLELAMAHPSETMGVDAARLALKQGATNTIMAALRGPDTNAAARLAQALGNTRQALPLLQPLLNDAHAALPVRREIVNAMARSEEGARALLARAAHDELIEDLRLTASLALSQARWPDIRDEAAKVLPPPLGRDSQPLPPLRELLRQTGDPALGKVLFMRADTGCVNCHQVGGAGRDVGPNLSEIGGKLGKDALYEAILNPSAGISFGFEPWSLELVSGEEAYGLIVSETIDEVALKDTAGIVTRYLKKDITGRRQSKVSIMPSGLQQTMSASELINLVEYLSSLKKQ